MLWFCLQLKKIEGAYQNIEGLSDFDSYSTIENKNIKTQHLANIQSNKQELLNANKILRK